MKKKIALILILTLLVALGAFAACEDPHEHDLQHFEAKDPTCGKEGNIEYWYCAGCEKYFADEAAGEEIAKEETVLAATGEHDWSEWVAGEGENCETGGTLRRSCSICGKTEEQTFPAGSHKLEYVGEVPSTCIEAGNRAHWHCEMCGKNFADQNAEELLEDVSLPLGAHNIVDGKCAVCGLDKTFIDGTPGLQYTLNKEGTAYTASGIGTATETDIVIASEYNGLPVTSIGNDAFYDCDSLTSIVIPNSVTSIGNRAFGGCDSLTSITLPDSVTSIGGAAFFHCYSLKSITIPDNVTSIGSSAFLGCDSLTSITIPDSVTSIDINTFANCDSLTSITIPDSVTSIGDYAFSWCDSLTSITIGDSVTSIGESAFLNCDSLTSIMIPDSVTSIGESAFSRCNSLTSIVIPDSVTNIGNGVFYGCSSLASIVVEEGNTVYHSDGNCIIETDSKTLVVGSNNSVIPSDGSVTRIGEKAFFHCYSLTSIVIPDSVTSIGSYAFQYCSSLTRVTIGDGVTSIGVGVFSDCSLLESIVVEEGNIVYHSEGNCVIRTDSKTLVVGCKNSVIPSNGSVTSIGDSAFFDCYSLKSITIPDSVTSIGNKAFAYCRSLTSIVIPDSVTSIGNDAFWGCNSLTSINIPDSVTSIGSGAFEYCSFKSITIPDGVTSIGKSAFGGCDSLESIIVEEGNTAYHSEGNCLIETDSKTLIAGCKNSVIPSDGSVTSIGAGAFYNCSSLTSISIPDSVTSIGNNAFQNCSSLTSIVIPEGVTSIGDSAFSRCNSLTSITFQGTVEQWRAIYKGEEWNLDAGSYTVICTDGVLDKNSDKI